MNLFGTLIVAISSLVAGGAALWLTVSSVRAILAERTPVSVFPFEGALPLSGRWLRLFVATPAILLMAFVVLVGVLAGVMVGLSLFVALAGSVWETFL